MTEQPASHRDRNLERTGTVHAPDHFGCGWASFDLRAEVAAPAEGAESIAALLDRKGLCGGFAAYYAVLAVWGEFDLV